MVEDFQPWLRLRAFASWRLTPWSLSSLFLVCRGFGFGRLLRRDQRLLLLIRVVRFRLFLRGLFLCGFRRSIAHGEYLSLSCLTVGMFVSPKVSVLILENVCSAQAPSGAHQWIKREGAERGRRVFLRSVLPPPTSHLPPGWVKAP